INFDIPIVEQCLNKQINKELIHDTAAYLKGELMGETSGKVDITYDFQKYILNQKRKGLKFNLAVALEHYKTPKLEGDAHRALIDVKNTYEVYKKQRQL